MFNSLKNFFNKTQIAENTLKPDEQLKLFCGIMIEAASMDGKIDSDEIIKIQSSLTDIFQEKPEQIKSIIETCIKEIDNPNSLHSFTSKINKIFTDNEKVNLLEILWEIVLLDGLIHDYESNLIRRLAGLMYISDVNCGNARKKALLNLNNQKSVQ